ncbi:MAG: phosphoribosylaminoimidazolesuccinocarboxamide synthase [Candidatus Margulisbacteria bacterium]|nr:phosphoribosylaminoimidazolesuccinocarboxamide synthase [Candidatus Margulisiibacteriota bacterium]
MQELELKNIKKFRSGKVREVFELGDKLLLVATDRISAFDFILPQAIPDKGKILNGISSFWFDKLANIIENHKITDDVTKYPAELQEYLGILEGRSVLVKKTEVVKLECIVRGYITGSGWTDYKKTGTVCGFKLPAGLLHSQKLNEPLFTPSTKAEAGEHDENISLAEAKNIVGKEVFDEVMDKSLALYCAARDYAETKGIIIADTKFEFGMRDNKIILIDEALTPDSSRFWPADKYQVGKDQPSFDKQIVRDYLLSLNWDKNPPVPDLPAEIVNKTRAKYIEAYEMLTDQKF